MKYLRNLLIATDQWLFCVVTLGHSEPDETLSAASWRWEQAGKPIGKVLRPLIDWGLSWLEYDHCYLSWLAEKNKLHLPKEYRE